jgi:hypothetical protein
MVIINICTEILFSAKDILTFFAKFRVESLATVLEYEMEVGYLAVNISSGSGQPENATKREKVAGRTNSEHHQREFKAQSLWSLRINISTAEV